MAIVKFEGKPIEKLIDVIAQAIGVVYEPTRIRRKAKAEVYRYELLSEAKANGQILKVSTDLNLAEQARERNLHQEINRQININSIADQAAGFLGEKVSERPVDQDWRSRFFNKAKDIYNEEMQAIWGKILAEEVTEPGSLSLRTLDILSNISRDEAIKFQKVCKVTFDNGEIHRSVLNDKNPLLTPIDYGDIIILRAAGLLHSNDHITFQYPFSEELGGAKFTFGKRKYLLRHETRKDNIFNMLAMSSEGVQLMNAIGIEKDMDHFMRFKKEANVFGYTIEELY